MNIQLLGHKALPCSLHSQSSTSGHYLVLPRQSLEILLHLGMGSIPTIPFLRCPPMTASRTSRLTEAQRRWIGENRHRTIVSIANYFKKQYSRSVSREVIRCWTTEGATKSPNYSYKRRPERPKTTFAPIWSEAKRLSKRGATVRSINKKFEAA